MRRDGLFTVGELARRCGVTVRTLQYYDREGLLSPKHYTEGGRRLYTREDIFVLQQILFLKSFGFSLQEIRDRLLHTDSPKEIAKLFSRQREALLAQIKNLEEMADLLDKTIGEIEMNGEVSTEKLVAIMGMMQMDYPFSFVLRYLGKKEMKTLFSWFDEEAEAKEIAAKWQAVFNEMIGLYKKGVDPEGPEGQALAAKWWDQVQAMTKGDQNTLQMLIGIGNDVDNWPEQAGDFKVAAKDFLSKALDKYLRDTGVTLERSVEQ